MTGSDRSSEGYLLLLDGNWEAATGGFETAERPRRRGSRAREGGWWLGRAVPPSTVLSQGPISKAHRCSYMSLQTIGSPNIISRRRSMFGGPLSSLINMIIYLERKNMYACRKNKTITSLTCNISLKSKKSINPIMNIQIKF